MKERNGISERLVIMALRSTRTRQPWALAGLAAAILLLTCTAFAQAEAVPAPEDRLAGILNDYQNYCAGETRRLGNPKVAREVQLGPTAIKEVLYEGQRTIILDASQMRCHDRHLGYCGSAGCSIFVFLPNRTTVLLGTLSVTSEFGEENPIYCGQPVDNWEGCETLIEHLQRREDR